MLAGAGPATMRVAAVVPVTLLVLFTGLLWLLGLMCGSERRCYVTELSQQAMEAVSVWLRGSVVPAQPGTRASRRLKTTQLKAIDGKAATADNDLATGHRSSRSLKVSAGVERPRCCHAPVR
jgi:hypothetical protein